MRKNKILLLLFAILLFNNQISFAQKDTSRKSSDSINAQILAAYNQKVQEVEEQHQADSIKKLELEAQLSSLKTSDNFKKEELQKKLQSINEKDSLRLALKKIQIDSLRRTAKGFAVTGFFNDTLFLIYSRLGSFSARDRADAISNRIHNLKDGFRLKKDTLKVVPSETTADIVCNENIIMSISENDALWNDTTKEALAYRYQTIISNALNHYRNETSITSLAKESGLALLTLVLMGLLIYYINKFFRWLIVKIRGQKDKRIKGIKIKNYTLFDAGREVNAIITVTTFIKWFFTLLVIYIALPIVFGIFPWTKNLASTLFGYVLSPVTKIAASFWHFVPNLITIIIIVIVFRYAMKGIRFLRNEIEAGNLKIPGFYADWANPTYQIVRVLVFAFMIVVIFPYLPGSNSPVFQGVSVFLGFLFTFGSAGSLSNIVAGLLLTYMRLFKPGDRVKIGDVTGDIIEKSLLVTRIRTIKNEIISIPNSTVMNSHTINYSSDAPDNGLIVHTTVTIGYDVPWKDLHAALIEAATRTKLILEDPKPFVLQTSLDDFYVSYQINAYTREANKQAIIYSDLHQNIQDVCNERGIEIMSPHYNAARDGNATAIPADYLPKDYKTPGFNINLNNNGEKDGKGMT